MKIIQATNGVFGIIGGILTCVLVAGLGISPYTALSRRRRQEGPPRRGRRRDDAVRWFSATA